jgi:hypothetical protein
MYFHSLRFFPVLNLFGYGWDRTGDILNNILVRGAPEMVSFAAVPRIQNALLSGCLSFSMSLTD